MKSLLMYWAEWRCRRRVRRDLPKRLEDSMGSLRRAQEQEAFWMRRSLDKDKLIAAQSLTVAELRARVAVAEDEFGASVPGLSDAEIERLAILAEECGEVVQAVGKVLRHGWDSQSPYGGKPNRQALERELGNVRAIVTLMLDAGDVRLAELQAWQRRKREQAEKWTHHQECSMPREAQLEMMRGIELARLEQER